MDKTQFDSQPHQYDSYEDEIELMDYLKVLWKWKYLILMGTLTCAAAAAIVSFNMTKVYSTKTVLAPGVAKVEANGKITHIGSAREIETLIATGALENGILRHLEVLGKEDPPKSLVFELKTPKGSNFLEVSYESADWASGQTS